MWVHSFKAVSFKGKQMACTYKGADPESVTGSQVQCVIVGEPGERDEHRSRAAVTFSSWKDEGFVSKNPASFYRKQLFHSTLRMDVIVLAHRAFFFF